MLSARLVRNLRLTETFFALDLEDFFFLSMFFLSKVGCPRSSTRVHEKAILTLFANHRDSQVRIRRRERHHLLMKVCDLEVGDVLVNAYGETVNLIVEVGPDVYSWVCLFGPPHFVIGVRQVSAYKPEVPLHDIWDLYRGGVFFLNEAERKNVEHLSKCGVAAEPRG